MYRYISIPFLALTLLLAPGCTSPQLALNHRISIGTDDTHGSFMVNDMLFFGLSRRGGEITQAEWQAFLAEVVTPRFPKGLTAWEAYGQWQGEDCTITAEQSRVLLLIHPDGSGYNRAVEEIIKLYKQRFEQESVMRARSPVLISF